MRTYCLLLLVVCAGCSTGDFLDRATVGRNDDGSYVVATQQIIDPAGESILFPGRPVDLAVSPDQSLLVVKNSNDLVFVDVATHTLSQTLTLPKGGNSACGITWTHDGKGVWTSESGSTLYYAQINQEGKFAWVKEMEIGLPGTNGVAAPGGFFLDEEKGRICVALSRNNSLGIINLSTKALESEIPVGIAPYTVLCRGSNAYVTNWGGRRPVKDDVTGPSGGSRTVVNPKTGVASTGTVSVVDLDARRTVKEIAVGLHPCAMVFAPDGSRLYVANANSDTISVIDTATDDCVTAFDVKPMKELPFGSAPNALALSADGKMLFAANGGNNAIAVIDTAQGNVKGLIPVGWYPGAVTLAHGDLLCVANIKGVGSLYEKANQAEKQKNMPGVPGGHNSHDLLGSVTLVAVPGDDELARLTVRVGVNMRLPMLHKELHLANVPERVVPVPSRPGEVSVFKHVIYIIKENRTYDQVFGDMPEGNGEPKLCQFGEEATPNQHALARQFVLLDNFYCNGVLSADGHQWCNEGYVADYLEKSFGGFPRSYPYEGEDALAFAPNGFIWDGVLAKGLSFRDYGEFVTAKIEPPSASWGDVHHDVMTGGSNVKIRATTQLHTLEPYLCPSYVGFPLKVSDTYRIGEFMKEFRAYEAKGELPNFIIMLLPQNHTAGTRPGMPTPRACVADNDYALGQLVDAVSHSRFWPDTAIFVVEDDPQAGLDHVDGHRTVALCISPNTKRACVDSTFYNQTGMLRTMELILGLAPLNQIDMASTPMLNAFTEKADLSPYTVRPNRIPLDEMNPDLKSLEGRQKYWAERSIRLPLDEADEADEDTLNRILWHSTMGYGVPYPKVAQAKRGGVVDRD